MNVIVCLKQVPDVAVAEFDIGAGELARLHWLLGQLDFIALEEALRLKEAAQAQVVVVTVGPERADEVLRMALTYGADAAIRVAPPGTETPDTFAVSKVLASVASLTGFDLVLCGARSADTGNGCVGAYLAAELDVPLISRVTQIDHADGTVVAQTRGEAGRREDFRAELPAVLTVEEGLNEPRYVPVLSRVYGRGISVPIEVWQPQDLGLHQDEVKPAVRTLGLAQPRPRTKVGVRVSGLSMEEKLKIMRGQTKKSGGEVFTGPPDGAARAILAKLSEWLP